MSLLTADYDYPLPDDLIARHPLPRRDASRMMVLHGAAQRIEHRMFADFPTYLHDGDLVVLNDTRVIPARAYSDDGKIELLFLEATGDAIWKCLVKPGKKMRVGASIVVAGNRGTVTEILPEGERLIAFEHPVDLDAAGRIPLPPYMERAAEATDTERYQTVFARARGAVAAPTAGLHFTPEILARIPHAFLTLHVGVGTFRPVQADDITQPSDARRALRRLAQLPPDAINAAHRIVAVGTTTTRVLETLGRPLSPQQGATDIFLHPPHRFRAVGALLTNFHLPKSTLLMLVSAFADREFILRAYAEAIRKRYRFYSYGDCMLIV